MPKKALIVENSFTDFEVFEKLLTELGYEVVTKKDNSPIMSFDEAIQAIKENSYIELALLDIDINGQKNGIDLASFFLTNNYNIRIIFTTAFFTNEAATQIAFLGYEIPIITKNSGVVDYNASLFALKAITSLKSQFHTLKFDNIYINAHAIDINKDVREQMLPKGIVAQEQVIKKNEILFLATGKGEKYLVPDEYVLFISKDSTFGYLSRISLKKLFLNSILDDRFIRINNNICINISYYLHRDFGQTDKHIIKLKNCETDFEISRSFKDSFKERFSKYGPISKHY